MNLYKTMLIKKDLASGCNKVKTTPAPSILRRIKEVQCATRPCTTVSQEDSHASGSLEQLLWPENHGFSTEMAFCEPPKQRLPSTSF